MPEKGNLKKKRGGGGEEENWNPEKGITVFPGSSPYVLPRGISISRKPDSRTETEEAGTESTVMQLQAGAFEKSPSPSPSSSSPLLRALTFLQRTLSLPVPRSVEFTPLPAAHFQPSPPDPSLSVKACDSFVYYELKTQTPHQKNTKINYLFYF